MTEPTKLDPDYYPRIKIDRRWYLIVPEIDLHEGCAFACPDDAELCKLIEANGGTSEGLSLFKRHDCGEQGTIFVTPAKFPEYRAHLVANKLEGNP
jgi:hypothetical protein